MTDLERALAAAERNFPIGRKVRFFPISGKPEFEVTAIRSKPWALGYGAIVIALEGRRGGCSILHLEVI